MLTKDCREMTELSVLTPSSQWLPVFVRPKEKQENDADSNLLLYLKALMSVSNQPTSGKTKPIQIDLRQIKQKWLN